MSRQRSVHVLATVIRVDRARRDSAVNLVGLHSHIGSNVFSAKSFAMAAEVMAKFAAPLDLPELVPLYEELYARKAYLPAEHTRPIRAQVADLARRFEIADRRSKRIRREPRPEQLSLAL